MFVDWDEKQTKGTGAGNRFLRLKEGTVKVRFFGRPVKYLRPPFRAGEEPRDAFLSNVVVDGQYKVLDMSASLYNAVAAYKEAGKKINALVSPEYVIKATGEKLERRYSVFAGEEKPLPEWIDVAGREQELLALADVLEQRKPR